MYDIDNCSFCNKVSLHDPNSPSDMRGASFPIPAGYLTKVQVRPREMVTLETAESLGIKDRNCQFSWENEGMVFYGEYSKTGCITECQIKMAFDK